MKRYLLGIVILGLVFGELIGFTSISFAQEKVVSGGSYNLSDYQELTGEKITEFSEAPALLELVEQGKILPVEERMPEEPLVVEPFEEIGEYGGTIRNACLGMASSAPLWWRKVHEPLIYYDKDRAKIYPNVARGWEVFDNGKTFIFYLREGMKWSDGEPFTADDIMFWFEDIISNEELFPVFPTWLTIGGKQGTVEKIDDYTVRFRFPEPYGLFLERIAEGEEVYAPKHYLKQFHPRYVDKAKLDGMAKKEGFSFWYQLFAQKNDWAVNPDLPEIRAWKTTVPPAFGQYQVSERNPYYWKIDPAGNQLPYVDKWRRESVTDLNIIVMKAVAGELDYQAGHIEDAFLSYTLLMENREKGNYRVLKATPSNTNIAGIYFNQTCEDPVLRSLFQNKMFRIALSLGINREEINHLILMGLGKPCQGRLSELHPAYVEEFDKAYIEYDPAEANRILDSLELTERDKDGYRLCPDGRTLAITIIATTHVDQSIDIMQLVAGYWKDLGIKVVVTPLEHSLFNVRTEANEFEVKTWSIGGGVNPLIDQYLAPNSHWCPLWHRWLSTGGESGEEPPEEVKRLWEIYQEAIATTSEEERNALLKEAMRLHAENNWIIGTVGIPWRIVVVKNNLRNVPEECIYWWPGFPGVTRPEQFFFKK